MSEWVPAQVASVDAFAVGGAVLLIAKGEKPSPCHLVDLVRDSQKVPVEFELRWRQNGVCDAALTPYCYAETFRAVEVTQVTVRHATGKLDVDVVHLEANSAIGLPSPVAISLPRPNDTPLPIPFPEATGYSRNFDFGEALRDAMQKLPPDPGPVPADWLTRFLVVDSGAEFGGIAGVRRMFVKVRRG